MIGFIILFIAGLCQGSFGLGYKKYSPFSWAGFWGFYNVFCIITTVGFTWIIAPELWSIYFKCGFSTLLIPILCGVLWGLSAIGFSKAISKIGMSIVYGISMGISTITGSIIPMFLKNKIPAGIVLCFFIAGLFLTILGIIVITIAGIERDLKGSSVVGIFLAIFSGLGSGAMNVGFAYSQIITNSFEQENYSQTAIACGKWLPILVSGCVSGIIWCIFELSAKHQWQTIANKGCLKRLANLFSVSIVWYAALVLYGLASNILGAIGDSIGWILFNSLALIISLGWGILTGEWKNKKKVKMYVGCLLLIASWIFITL